MCKALLTNTIKFTAISICVFSLHMFLPTTVISSDETGNTQFVDLLEVDPTIHVEMRYSGNHNFIGRPVKGYEVNKCLLLKDVALALTQVQDELSEMSLGLKIYDCYRPQMAVNEFVEWAGDFSDQKMKVEFYPHEDKTLLIKNGYIASRSGHSRGNSVDLTIIAPSAPSPEVFSEEIQRDCTELYEKRYHDDSLDMGTGFDCFDIRSHTLNDAIDKQAIKNRLLLKAVMEKHGFSNYRKEWWHYTYIDPEIKSIFYNFPIK